MYKKRKASNSPSINTEIPSDTNIQQQEWLSVSLPPPPLIWFILVDSDTGQSYKGTSASSVSLPSGSVIDQFRDAVKVKHSNKLSSIDAADLVVYKNKASFDKRNDVLNHDDSEEGKPLEEDSFIAGLGKSKREALIVVVPVPIPSSQFEPCAIEFYNNIYSATEFDGWLSFGQDKIPPTDLNRLYIRESYRTIACNIKPGNNGRHKVIVTGTPGIGKSLFLYYLLWKMVVKEGKRVLMIYHPFNVYYDGKGGVFEINNGHYPSANDVSFWNDSLWCLFDTKGKNEADLHQLSYDFCNFILSTSPRREIVNDFKKPPVPQYFYMPPWTKSEMESISSLFPNMTNTEWHERFEILGGIPRYVFEDTIKQPTQILEVACKNCSLEDCIKYIGLDSELSEKSKKILHSLIHMTSSPPFTEPSVCYASQAAMSIIVRNKGLGDKHKMRDLLESCEGNPLTAALCGYIFEPYAIEVLEKGGEFKCRRLVHGNTKKIPGDMELYIPPSTKEVVDNVSSEQTHKKLYVPKTKTYTAIDAWMPGIGAFQMTVGKKHVIEGGVRADLAKLGPGTNKLYWLLPPLYYNNFTKKTPQDIDQYAVQIDYPA